MSGTAMNAIRRLAAWWLVPLPAERLAVLRLSIGGMAAVYLAVRAPSFAALAGMAAHEYHPVGLFSVLAQPLPPLVLHALLAVGLASGAAFAAGAWFALSGPLFALTLLALTTYRSSFGMIFHTENLLTLHVLLLGVSRAADALSVDARRRPGAPAPSREYGWVIRALCLVTVLAYMLAGVAKLKLAGGPWLEGELLRKQIAYDNLRKLELGTDVFPLGPWLVRQRSAFPVLAVATMLVELGAFLALVRARWAKAWVLAAWGFHVGVLVFMSIAFFYQLSGFAYLSFFPVERALEWRRSRRRAQASRLGASPSEKP